MRLFHFSENPSITRFVPRPVLVPAVRPPGNEWLNGPLVWAIDGWHQPMYLFPRDCPRILVWPTARTTERDRKEIWGTASHRMIAFVERRWLPMLRETSLYRYEVPPTRFQSLDDAGMWVSNQDVSPIAKERMGDLLLALRREDVEVRALDSLVSLRGLWKTSLHASGIRLRHAVGWSLPEAD
jgi:hypothetical protein